VGREKRNKERQSNAAFTNNIIFCNISANIDYLTAKMPNSLSDYNPVQKVSDLRPGKKVAYLGGLLIPFKVGPL
jgi:hypothetical protein